MTRRTLLAILSTGLCFLVLGLAVSAQDQFPQKGRGRPPGEGAQPIERGLKELQAEVDRLRQEVAARREQLKQPVGAPGARGVGSPQPGVFSPGGPPQFGGGPRVGRFPTTPEGYQTNVIRLKNARAEQIATMLTRLYSPGGVDIRLVADERTNCVVIYAPTDQFEMVGKVIAVLDQTEGTTPTSPPKDKEDKKY